MLVEVLRRVALLLAVSACRIGFDAGSLTADRATLEFASVPCAGSTSAVVTVSNNGQAPFSFTAIGDIPNVTITPSDGMLAPGKSVELTVAAQASASATPGEAMTGELVITTDDKALSPLSIPISLTTAGAVLDTDMTTLDFGQVTTSTSHSGNVMVENTGNMDAAVTVGPFGSGPFSITSASTFNLAPGASQPVAVQFDPTASQAYSSQLPITVNGAVCAAVPQVAVAGTGTNSTVLLDHTTLDFGNATCGSTTTSLPLTLTNSNASSFPYTANVNSGGASFTASPTSGTVPANGTAMVSVTRAAVPVPSATGMVTGNLHVAVNGGNSDVALQYNVLGPSLSPSTTTLAFGQRDHATTLSLMITNSGNDVADVTMTRSGASNFSGPTSFQVSPGTSSMVSITFTPTGQNQMFAADFAVSATGACSSPFSIHTTGTSDD